MRDKINLGQKRNNMSPMPMRRTSHPIRPQYESNDNYYQNETPNNEQDYDNEYLQSYEEPQEEYNQYQNNYNNGIAMREMAKDEAKGYVKSAILKSPIVKKIILIGIPVILVSVIVIGLVISIIGVGNSGMGIGGYYDLRCDEVNVIFVDKNNNYEVTGTQTYDLEEYVAGVVFAETGNFRNLETYKVFALAARTFVQEMADDSCSIEASSRRQAFKDISELDTEATRMIRQAVEETAGQVLIQDNEIISVRYDAFCACDKTGDYYTLVQARQKIPKSWADQRASGYTKIADDLTCDNFNNKDHDCVMGHGSGMSQYGTLYLATEEGYTYDQIISFYYGDEVTIGAPFITSIAGLDLKNTRKAKYQLNMPLTDYLASQGSSLEQMNTFIKENVQSVGVGTREAVVVSAVSLINFLYDNFNAKLPYYWGGAHMTFGASSRIGTYHASQPSPSGHIYYVNSFDCSGFVSWAIKNGGYKFSRYTTVSFHNAFAKESCSVSSPTCIGQPGDLINSRSSHVILILGVNPEKGTYFVAHSTGGGVLMEEIAMNTSIGNDTRILFMDSFYKNPENIDPNYPE